MRRPLWLGAGVAVGVAGTLWAEQRVRRGVRRTVQRLTPGHMAEEARSSAKRLSERVRQAVEVGREERDRREAELWRDLSAGQAGRDRGAGRRGTRVHTSPDHAQSPGGRRGSH